ncbi:MAG: hypothetical protein V3S52_03060 [Gemmatimonadota bacterium]
MNVVDLLVTIIVVTILVTIALGVVTYIAYKLRLARRPVAEDEDASAPHFFQAHDPPAAEAPPDPPVEEDDPTRPSRGEAGGAT